MTVHLHIQHVKDPLGSTARRIGESKCIEETLTVEAFEYESPYRNPVMTKEACLIYMATIVEKDICPKPSAQTQDA